MPGTLWSRKCSFERNSFLDDFEMLYAAPNTRRVDSERRRARRLVLRHGHGVGACGWGGSPPATSQPLKSSVAAGEGGCDLGVQPGPSSAPPPPTFWGSAATLGAARTVALLAPQAAGSRALLRVAAARFCPGLSAYCWGHTRHTCTHSPVQAPKYLQVHAHTQAHVQR